MAEQLKIEHFLWIDDRMEHDQTRRNALEKAENDDFTDRIEWSVGQWVWSKTQIGFYLLYLEHIEFYFILLSTMYTFADFFRLNRFHQCNIMFLPY